jgi:hypothetical protein
LEKKQMSLFLAIFLALVEESSGKWVQPKYSIIRGYYCELVTRPPQAHDLAVTD